MRSHWLIVLGVLAALGVRAASAAEAYTDFDRRATRTLLNTLKPDAVPTKDKADPAQLTAVKKDGNRAMYTLEFPGPDGKSMLSGYYRVSINNRSATSKDWKLMGVDPGSGAAIVSKPVEPTNAEPYMTYGARRQIGNVVLTVAMRRPENEDRIAAAADMAKRCRALLSNARADGLLPGVRVKANGREPPAVAEGVPTKLLYALEIVDGDGKAVAGATKLKLRVTGPLTKYATVEGKRVKNAGEAFEIDAPQATEAVTVVVSGDAKAIKAALDAHGRAAVGIEADVEFGE